MNKEPFNKFKEVVNLLSLLELNAMIDDFKSFPSSEKSSYEYLIRYNYLIDRKIILDPKCEEAIRRHHDLNDFRKIIDSKNLEQLKYMISDWERHPLHIRIHDNWWAKYNIIVGRKMYLKTLEKRKEDCPSFIDKGKYGEIENESNSFFDPNAPEEKGSRHNEGKLRWSLLDLKYLEGLVQVLMMGANKYGDFNWQKGLPTTEIYESLMRHVIAWKSGEDKDAESGLDHIDHAICNLYFIKWMIANKPEMDTRNKLLNVKFDFEPIKYPDDNEK